MFDFDTLIGHQIDRIRPMAQSASEQAQVWAERVCDKLDRIAVAVENEEFTEQRKYLDLGTLQSGQTVEIAQVPAADEWYIDYITTMNVVTPTAGYGIQVKVGGLTRLAKEVKGDDIIVVPGMVVQGGTPLSVRNVTGGAMDVFIQVRVKRPKHAPLKGRGGVREQPAEPGIAPPNPEPFRHTGTFTTGARQ